MQRLPLLLVALLLVLVTNATAAEGINLRWSLCFGDGSASNRNFACATNAGVNVLIGSFELGDALAQVSGQEFTVEVLTQSATLPAWWAFKNPATCRQTSLSVNFVAPGGSCVDWANSQSAGGLGAYNIGYLAPNRARILGVVAVPQSALADLDPFVEYYSFTLVINNVKSVGSGACAGCSTPANILLSNMKVTTPVAANDRILSNPAHGFDSNLATWQGGFPVATRRETWGAVKALYR